MSGWENGSGAANQTDRPAAYWEIIALYTLDAVETNLNSSEGNVFET